MGDDCATGEGGTVGITALLWLSVEAAPHSHARSRNGKTIRTLL